MEYRASLEIGRRLADQDPGNAGWQTDLAGACWRIAFNVDSSKPEGLAEARQRLEQAVDILRRLSEAGRLSPYWQQWLPKYQSALERLAPPGESP